MLTFRFKMIVLSIFLLSACDNAPEKNPKNDIHITIEKLDPRVQHIYTEIKNKDKSKIDELKGKQ